MIIPKECRFELNGEIFHLTFYEKPILTNRGLKIKALPKLKEYIELNKIPINIKNKNGGDKNTYAIASEVISYHNYDNGISQKVNTNDNFQPKLVKEVKMNTKNEIDFNKLKENIGKSKGDYIIVYPCSKKKHKRYFNYSGKNIMFQSNPLKNRNLINSVHPDEIIDFGPDENLTTWRNYIANNQSDKSLYEAYNLYMSPCYRNAYSMFKENFYILSAGWGIINSNFKIPFYDITTSGEEYDTSFRDLKLNRNYKEFQDFNKLDDKALLDKTIVFIIPETYNKLLLDLLSKMKHPVNNAILICYNSDPNTNKEFNDNLYDGIINLAVTSYYSRKKINWQEDCLKELTEMI